MNAYENHVNGNESIHFNYESNLPCVECRHGAGEVVGGAPEDFDKTFCVPLKSGSRWERRAGHFLKLKGKNMKQHFTMSALLSSLFAAGIFALALPANAQMGSGMMGDKMGNSMPGPGIQQMSGLQRDMANQMMGMSGEMAKDNMSAAQQQMMSERMNKMGAMMGDMSGMMGQGMMMDANTQKRMDQMRMQINGMMRSGSPGMK